MELRDIVHMQHLNLVEGDKKALKGDFFKPKKNSIVAWKINLFVTRMRDVPFLWNHENSKVEESTWYCKKIWKMKKCR